MKGRTKAAAGTAAATLARGATRRIVAHFTSAGATVPAHPVAFARPAGRVEARIFDRMVRFGALREEGAGRYWLDRRRMDAFGKESLARVLVGVAAAAFAAAGAIALGG